MKNVQTRMVVSGFVAAAAVALGVAQSGLIGFGVKDSEVKARLVDAVWYGNLPVYPSAKLYYAGSTAARVAFVKAFLNTARMYSESAAFKEEYAKRRAEARPHAPAAKGSADRQLSDAQAAQRKQLEDLKAQVSKMSPEMQQQMQPTIKMLEEQLKQQASDPSQQALMKQMYEAQAKGEQEDYQKSLAKWSADYPEQPGVLIAKRLKNFLALTSDMDFSAKLESAGAGRMRFANPAYEAKSAEWKLCYRAGREPVAAARAVAEDWLHQLGGE
jgi:flagellar biosynthesis GTPase FlhF